MATCDRDMQRIVWRSSEDEKIRDYRLNTVTYGTAAVPYLSTRYLQADDRLADFPHGSQVLRDSFYVDDLMAGCDNLGIALVMQAETVKLLASAGFPLRKWDANQPALLEHTPVADRQVIWNVSDEKGNCIKTLGMAWQAITDKFLIRVSKTVAQRITKRKVLSETAQLSDPLGLVSPVIVWAKVFIKDLWKMNLDWED